MRRVGRCSTKAGCHAIAAPHQANVERRPRIVRSRRLNHSSGISHLRGARGRRSIRSREFAQQWRFFMCRRFKLFGGVAGLMIAASTAPIDVAEAAGQRISARLQRSPVITVQPRRLAGPAPRTNRAVRSALRPTAVVRSTPVSRGPVSSSVRGPRVAGFAQRANSSEASNRLAVGQTANGRARDAFINGYREYSILGFRSGDFFERQQGIGSQGARGRPGDICPAVRCLAVIFDQISPHQCAGAAGLQRLELLDQRAAVNRASSSLAAPSSASAASSSLATRPLSRSATS